MLKGIPKRFVKESYCADREGVAGFGLYFEAPGKVAKFASRHFSSRGLVHGEKGPNDACFSSEEMVRRNGAQQKHHQRPAHPTHRQRNTLQHQRANMNMRLHVRGPEMLQLSVPFSDSVGRLIITDCPAVLSLPRLPSYLKALNLSSCKSLLLLPLLPHSLRTINLQGCRSLASIPAPLPMALTKLDLEGCKSLTALPPLPSKIKTLVLNGCEELTSIPTTLPESLQKLQLDGCRAIMELPPLTKGLAHLYPDLMKVITKNLKNSPALRNLQQDESTQQESAYLTMEDLNVNSPEHF